MTEAPLAAHQFLMAANPDAVAAIFQSHANPSRREKQPTGLDEPFI